MTSRLGQLRQLEQRMTRVRLFATAFAVVSVGMQPYYPSLGVTVAAWAMVAFLLTGTLAIWGASARIKAPRQHEWLGAGAFAFDAVVIGAVAWIFAFDRTYTSWALMSLLPLEGALRYRMRGALVAAAAGAVFLLPVMLHRADLTGDGFDASMYVFAALLAFLIAAFTGSMAEQWHSQSIAFERQSLSLAELDRMKDRFLAVTSHELRGPLTAIIAGSETVRRRRERLTAEQQDKLLEMVWLQGRQLARLVDDLTVTSQLQAGRLDLQIEVADVAQVIDQSLEAAESKRRDHQLEVLIDPVDAAIDASRVGQIVRNLVENAFKYTPAGSRVRVTVRSTPQGLSIDVADNGPGIPADKREQLFEAFVRIEETSAGQEGVGLGLYVVSQLVARMDGRIDLRSDGDGTSFRIFIPCNTLPRERHLGLVPHIDHVERDAREA